MHEPLGHIAQPVSPASSDPPPSLWRELADGSAGPVVRAVVSFALAPLLAGTALWGSFVLAGWMPSLARRWGNQFSPGDELIACMLLLAAVAYVLALCWLWTRGRFRLNGFLRAALRTIALIAAVMFCCFVIFESSVLRGSQEILVSGVIFMAISALILIWLQAFRGFKRRPSWPNAIDGIIDLRCPECGYRMVGLHESRCPECGTSYTLDELLARQEFQIPRAPLDTTSAPRSS